MNYYTGSSQKCINLESNPFASGGEASVYRIMNDGHSVAKIFHQFNTEKQKKLQHMFTYAIHEAAQFLAWPTELLYDNSGQFAGYLMPYISGDYVKLCDIISMSNQKARRWDLRVHIAMNLAAAVDNLHKFLNIEIGDFNQNNILVNQTTGRVVLIDCDSFNIAGFPCQVGMAQYLPYELQGANLRLSTFTKESDNFALYVLIFQVLFNGCHPYTATISTQISATGNMQVDNIKKRFFPFSQSRLGMGIPNYSPKLDSVPPELQQLFIRAFCEPFSSRPSASEMYHSLGKLSAQIKACPLQKAHFHWQGSSCPWCLIEGVAQQTVPKPQVKVQAATIPVYVPPVNIPINISKKQYVLSAVHKIGNGLQKLRQAPLKVGFVLLVAVLFFNLSGSQDSSSSETMVYEEEAVTSDATADTAITTEVSEGAQEVSDSSTESTEGTEPVETVESTEPTETAETAESSDTVDTAESVEVTDTFESYPWYEDTRFTSVGLNDEDWTTLNNFFYSYCNDWASAVNNNDYGYIASKVEMGSPLEEEHYKTLQLYGEKGVTETFINFEVVGVEANEDWSELRVRVKETYQIYSPQGVQQIDFEWLYYCYNHSGEGIKIVDLYEMAEPYEVAL